MKDLLLVGLGGFAGSVLRYKIGSIITAKTNTGFPYGTFCVNLVGAFLIGLLVSSALKTQQTAMLLLVAGFCGGFTTFSTFALENLRLLQTGNWTTLLTYTLLSILGGICICWLGYLVGNYTNSSL